MRPAAKYALHAAVVIVKPGGTGRPAFVISASPAPFPPRSSRIFALPSALPFAKRYTHFVRAPLAFARVGADDFARARLVRTATATR